MSFSGYSLRTSKVDINCINFILNHFGSLDNSLGVIPTKLCDNRFVLWTGAKMIFLVIFSTGHHLGVKHGGVGQISAVSPAEKSEGQFGLLNHWSADIERILEPRNLIVDLLLIHTCYKRNYSFSTYEEQSWIYFSYI